MLKNNREMAHEIKSVTNNKRALSENGVRTTKRVESMRTVDGNARRPVVVAGKGVGSSDGQPCRKDWSVGVVTGCRDDCISCRRPDGSTAYDRR